MSEKEQQPRGSSAAGEDAAGASLSTHSITLEGPSQGADTIAQLLRGDDPQVELETLPEPWRGIAEAVGQADVMDRSRAFATALAGLQGGATEIQGLVYSALDDPAEDPGSSRKLRREKERPIGRRLSRGDAERAIDMALSSPDPRFMDELTAALLEKRDVLDIAGNPVKTAYGTPKRVNVPALLKRRKAGRLLLEWLACNGSFVQSEAGEYFYFFLPKQRLFSLKSEHWSAWLFALTGLSPTTTDYVSLLDYCKAAAINAPQRRVVRVGAWDDVDNVLRVSSFDGRCFVLDGSTIEQEVNGQSILFDDDLSWVPYAPRYNGGEALRWITEDLPSWSGDRKLLGLMLRIWVLTTFFSELSPSRPMLVLDGERGSGKSMLACLLLRMLLGPTQQVSGVPAKIDDFKAVAAKKHLLCLDNLDDLQLWLRDLLARNTTGADDNYRRLYTDNEAGRIIYRTWIMITSRSPDTLKRDDLADRMVKLPVVRLSDEQRRKERDLFRRAGEQRDLFWGDLLQALNKVVAGIRSGGLEGKSMLRLADWEALGRVIAASEGSKELWERACEQIKEDQSEFLLEGDLLVQGLNLWLDNPENRAKEVTSRELQDALQVLLFDGGKPPSDWPKSTVGFGRRLANIRRDLKSIYDLTWQKGTEARNRGIDVYRFWLKGEMPEQETMEL